MDEKKCVFSGIMGILSTEDIYLQSRLSPGSNAATLSPDWLQYALNVSSLNTFTTRPSQAWTDKKSLSCNLRLDYIEHDMRLTPGSFFIAMITIAGLASLLLSAILLRFRFGKYSTQVVFSFVWILTLLVTLAAVREYYKLEECTLAMQDVYQTNNRAQLPALFNVIASTSQFAIWGSTLLWGVLALFFTALMAFRV